MTVSIIVPMRADVLAATADYFRALADIETQMDARAPFPVEVSAPEWCEPVTPEPEPEPEPEPAAPSDPEPAPPPPPAPERPADTDVDSAGEAYDPRIHSSSKSFVKGGTWKLKRGIDPEYVAAVRSGNVPPVAAAPVAPPPPPVPERPATARDFAGLMSEASRRYGSGAIMKLNEIAKSIGLNGFAFLATDPENLATAWELLTNE